MLLLIVGIVHLVLKGYGNVYTWNKVSTTVHNIIMGQPWIENHGEMEMIDHSTGVKCLMKYIPTSMFSRETGRKVYAPILNELYAIQFMFLCFRITIVVRLQTKTIFI